MDKLKEQLEEFERIIREAAKAAGVAPDVLARLCMDYCRDGLTNAGYLKKGGKR